MKSLNNIWCILLLFLSTLSGFGQDAGMVKQLIKFDPLFWKDELNLRETQYTQIKSINTDFYEELKVLIHKYNNRSDLRNALAESLIHRSQRIWETLQPKQRKKLEKVTQKWDVNPT